MKKKRAGGNYINSGKSNSGKSNSGNHQNNNNRHQNNRRSQSEQKPNETGFTVESCFMTANGTQNKSVWILDSGATSSITWNKECFSDYIPCTTSNNILCPDGSTHKIHGQGSVILNCKQGDTVKTLKFDDVLHVPTCKYQLLSEVKAVKCGLEIWKKNQICQIRKDNKIVLEARLDTQGNQLFIVETVETALACTHEDIWHQRLGHASEKCVNELQKQEIIYYKDCEDCALAKAQKTPAEKSQHRATIRKLELVHSDIMGPISPPTPSGKHYILTFIDDYTKDSRLELLSKKSEAAEAFIRMQKAATLQCGLQIGTVRTDNGGEYTSKQFTAYVSC
jgi:hypothetical protein